MQIIDLYRVIIRIFAIYLLVKFITFFVPLISSLVYDLSENSLAIGLIIVLLVLLTFVIILIYKTDSIIHFLKLEKIHNATEIQPIPFNDYKIINLAVCLIGISLFINHITPFLYQSFTFFQSSKHEYSGHLENLGVAIYFDFHEWILAISNIVIGYLMISNNDLISNFLDKKVVEKSDSIDDNL
ncbi:MAG: hypothetical protein AB8B72_10680 [Crocinitomicaceae bacterium]